MKYFCSKCGKTTQYNFELPKFCAFCGQSFANKLESQQSETQRSKFLNELKLKKNINQNDYEDNEEDTQEENPNINFKSLKAKYKLDIYNPKGESFGALIDNPAQPMEKFNNDSYSQKTSEQILEEFKKESASIRNKE